MLKAVAVDDEKRSRNRLERIIQSVNGINLTVSFSCAKEILTYLESHKIDIVFLDIEMPEMNGIELGDIIAHTYKNIDIVYITAYNKYAIEAFDVFAIGYLLKPINIISLQKIIDRIIGKKNNYIEKQLSLHVDMLGKPRCYIGNDTNDLIFRTKKAEELFLFLIHNKGSLISRDEITNNIWQYMDKKKAITNFHTTSYYIRDMLKGLGLEGVLIKERRQYSIDITRIKCDIDEFMKLYDVINKSVDDIVTLELLADLFKGQYCENKNYEWAITRRAWCDSAYISTLYKLEKMYLDQGSFLKVYSTLEKIINFSPLEDRAYIKLVKYYIDNQEYMQAIKYYNKYKIILRDELRIKPDEGLRRLVQSII